MVAVLKGSDPILSREYIVIESHLDGAVGTRAVNGDDIYNAADDNASGSAGTLAIAEALAAGPRPKRSVIFLWDSGEERGLWGTRFFVSRPPVPLERIVAEFNIDMIGANRAPGSPDADAAGTTGPNEVYLIGPGVLSTSVDALLDAVNRGYLNLRFNREHDRGESEFFYPRSDAGPFLERGILTIGFTTGMHARYHGPADEARFLDSGQDGGHCANDLRARLDARRRARTAAHRQADAGDRAELQVRARRRWASRRQRLEARRRRTTIARGRIPL